MADGLEKMIATRVDNQSAPSHLPSNAASEHGAQNASESNTVLPTLSNPGVYGDGIISNGFIDDFDLTTTPFLHFDSGEFDFSLSGFGL